MRNARTVQFVLFGIYLVFGVLAGVLWLGFAQKGFADADKLGLKIAATFAAPIGLVIGSVMANPRAKRIDAMTVGFCIVLVLLWNIVILGCILYTRDHFVFLKDSADNIEKVATAMNFLTVGVLAFVFGKAK